MSTRHLLGLVLLAATSSAHAAPNTTCADATIVAEGVPVTGSTIDVEAGDASACAVDDTHALWFRFTAPSEDRYRLTTIGSTIDTTIAIYDGCDGAVLACNDDPLDSLQGEAFIWFDEGQTVWVRVGGWGGVQGDIRLTIDTAAALDRPPNDLCEDAIPLVLGRGAHGSTLHVSGTDESSCGPEDEVDIWYSFVAPTAGEYTFGLTKNMVSAHYISLYDDCGGTELACGFLGTSATLAEGQRVIVRVGTNPAVADWFNVIVGPAPADPVPPNDTPQTAIPLTVPSTVYGTTRGATPDYMYWGPTCTIHVNNTVWYSFTAPSDGVYIFDTNGSVMEDTIVAVFERCDYFADGPPPLIECNNDDGIGKAARLEGFIAAGTSLCVAVGGYFLDEFGDFRLNVSTPLAPPANDTCEKAAGLGIGEPVYGSNVSATPIAPVGACPFGEFALWYRFTAPADGEYKFDVKASTESSPDIALYDDCDTTTPLACDTNPWPAVHLDMVQGQTVRVRIATDVFWRNVMAVRVTPLREPDAPVVEEDPAVELVEDVVELAPETTEPEPSVEVVEPAVTDISEPDSVEPDSVEPDGVETDNAQTDHTRGAVEGGCGCQGGDAASGFVLVALAWLALVSRARRSDASERLPS